MTNRNFSPPNHAGCITLTIILVELPLKRLPAQIFSAVENFEHLLALSDR